MICELQATQDSHGKTPDSIVVNSYGNNARASGTSLACTDTQFK
jgi:hypothetical protein